MTSLVAVAPAACEAVITFTDIGASIAQRPGGASSWGDYDSDGDLDLVVGSSDAVPTTVAVVRNDGGGVFTMVWAHGALRYASLALGDYDNDADLDVLYTGGTTVSPDLWLYRNAGDSLFVVDSLASYGAIPFVDHGCGEWGDYDNDGDLDVLVSGNGLSGPLSAICRNDAGVFTDIGAALAGLDASAGAWGDYDNDGDLDILIAGDSASVRISRVYRNSSGVFGAIAAGLPGVSNGCVAWGDYDSDGDLDIVIAGDTGATRISRVYRNNGGVFTDIAAGLPGVGPAGAQWGDYDNDGDLDLLISGSTVTGRISRVYQNNDGAFTDIVAGLTGLTGRGAAWGDYDNDGDLDILISGLAPGFITRVYRSDGAPANTPPSAPTGPMASLNGARATFSWIASSDGQTASAGLSYNLRVGTTPGGNQIVPAMASSSTGYRRVVRLGDAQKRTSWTVQLPGEGRYYWSTQAIDGAFAGSPFAPEQTLDYATSVEGTAGAPVPTHIQLHDNVPNPFNPTTSITFDLPVASHVRLFIFDATGRRVRLLVEEDRSLGSHTIAWDGTDDRGRRVASGIYRCRMEAGTFNATSSLTLVR